MPLFQVSPSAKSLFFVSVLELLHCLTDLHSCRAVQSNCSVHAAWSAFQQCIVLLQDLLCTANVALSSAQHSGFLCTCTDVCRTEVPRGWVQRLGESRRSLSAVLMC